MSESSFRWGVLGTGNIAGQFCWDLKALPTHRLVAVASRSGERATEFCHKHGGSPVARYETLFDRADIDGIYLSLPNSMHAQWTIAALRAGYPVLCEKPLATSLAEAEEMFFEAEQAKKPLVEAFMYRCHPQTSAILKTIRDGVIGTLTHIRTAFSYRTTTIAGNVRFDRHMAGGALMDVGCYCLDFACLLADAPIGKVAAASRRHASGVDVMTTGLIEFTNGVAAEFVCGMDTPTDNTAIISGTDGYLTITWPWKPRDKAGFTIHRGIPPKQDLKSGEPAVAPPPQFVATSGILPLYALEAKAFADHVTGRAASFMPKDHSLRLATLMEQVQAAASP